MFARDSRIRNVALYGAQGVHRLCTAFRTADNDSRKEARAVAIRGGVWLSL